MPCTTPPWTCPSTTIGLITFPTSSTATYFARFTAPISVSTSTRARCVPWGYENTSGSTIASPVSTGDSPPGRLWAVNEANASSWMVLAESGDPRTLNLPSLNSRSDTSHSSTCAASVLAFSTTFRLASTMAMPPTAKEREPYVSRPIGAVRVSPCTTMTSSNGTPSASAAIWAKVVSWAWPCGEVPVTTSTLPSGNTRTVAASQPPATYPTEPSHRDGASPHISV